MLKDVSSMTVNSEDDANDDCISFDQNNVKLLFHRRLS
jgi:hypothetical protein